jgi:TPR repeat protein
LSLLSRCLNETRRDNGASFSKKRRKIVDLTLQELQKTAEQGDVEAQYELGCAYHVFAIVHSPDNGVAQDAANDKAVEWWTKAAEQGHAKAQCFLGRAYHAQDAAKAVEWWTKAAEQDHAGAQYQLGEAYYDGEGVAQDAAKAVECWTRAADQGHAGAQDTLDVVYHNGRRAQDVLKA